MKNYGYDRNDVYADFERLPKGGYVGKIVNVKWEEGQNGNSDMLKFAFDITEGEYADYFKQQYENNRQEDKKWKGTFNLFCPKNDGSEKDGWTRKKFNTTIANIEDSNPGFHFDGANEACLKGKAVGLTFRDKEYQKNDGTIGICTECAEFTTVQKIKNGTFKVPNDKLLQKNTSVSNEGLVNIPTNTGEDELPF